MSDRYLLLVCMVCCFFVWHVPSVVVVSFWRVVKPWLWTKTRLLQITTHLLIGEYSASYHDGALIYLPGLGARSSGPGWFCQKHVAIFQGTVFRRSSISFCWVCSSLMLAPYYHVISSCTGRYWGCQMLVKIFDLSHITSHQHYVLV